MPFAAFGILVGLLAWPANGALESGGYQTLPGASVEERGDRVLDGFRVVPLSATVTFDLSAAPPSLTAVITDAVLEGGRAFPLTVRSLSGAQLADGTYRFTGDYLRDLYPAGTQYLFDWEFSASAKGDVVWNGTTGWAGGHLWYLTISNITLVPLPRLTVSRADAASIRISWATNFSQFVLECVTNLPAVQWSAVTNQVTTNANRLSVVVGIDASQRLYRLHKP